jgi:hypothetical protein
MQTLFIVYFCRCCPRKRKKEKKVLLPTGASRSTTHAVLTHIPNMMFQGGPMHDSFVLAFDINKKI